MYQIEKSIEQQIEDIHAESNNSPAWYFRLTRLKGMVEKLIKPMNEHFKTDMLTKGDTTRVADGYKLIITEQDKSTVDDEKLVKLLKKKKLKAAIIKVEKPDHAAVEMLVSSGEITPQELAFCQIPKFVKVLNVTEIKGAAKNG